MARAGLTVEQRIAFLEDDQDRSDRRHTLLVAETRGLLVKVLFAVITLSFTIIGGIVVALVTR